MTLDDELEFLELDALRACAVCGDPFCASCEAPDRRREADALQAHADKLRAEAEKFPRFIKCRWLTEAMRYELRARRLVRPTRVDDDAA
jgi:hypothetical protein